MIEEIQQDAKSRMGKSVESLKSELSKIRTGRAHTSLLDHIKVEYYGSEVPLSNAANITVEDARTLAVTVWEKDMIPIVEKAIMTSDLGLTPNSAGTVIRVPLPALTEERRRDLIKVVRHEGESARVAIRNIRRDANGDFKDLVKEKMISEDEEHRAAEQIQKLTDEYVGRIDAVIQEKEKELLEV